MIEVKEGLRENWIEVFYEEINKTSMKRNDFEVFQKAYESRDIVLSIWSGGQLVAFGSMLSDWTMNSVIYDVVVTKNFERKGYGKQVMDELMKRAPGSRFSLTSTFGSEEFYKKLGFKKHKTAFALYPNASPYLED